MHPLEWLIPSCLPGKQTNKHGAWPTATPMWRPEMCHLHGCDGFQVHIAVGISGQVLVIGKLVVLSDTV